MSSKYRFPIAKPLSAMQFVQKYPELYYEMQNTLVEGGEMLRKNDIESNKCEREYFKFTEHFKMRVKKYKQYGKAFQELQNCAVYNALMTRCEDMFVVLVRNEKTGVYKNSQAILSK